jgi:hypothetical protein
MSATSLLTKDYKNQPLRSRPENTPSQTQCQDGELYSYDDPVDANLFYRLATHAGHAHEYTRIHAIMPVFTGLAKSRGHKNADF